MDMLISVNRNYLPAIPLATITTAGLLIMMYSLIATDFIEPIDDPVKIDTSFLDPVRQPTPPERKKLVRPEEVQQPPERLIAPTGIETASTNFNLTDFAFKPPIQSEVFINPDSGPIPSVRVEPNYPTSALRRGIEGYVDLMFDINAAGSTENIRVVGGNPERVFNKAAIKALSKWKYQPQTIDGKAVTSYNQATRLTFTIAD